MEKNNRKPTVTKTRTVKTESTNDCNAVQAVTKSRGMSGSTFAIIALSLLLAASLVLGLTFAFFTGSDEAEGTITLGNPVNITITQGGANADSLTFSGSAMPGTVYNQKIAISQPSTTSDSVVRAKLTLTNVGSASINVEAATSADWTKGEDDYYYFNGISKAGESHDFVNSITVPKGLTNADATKTYTINIVVEAIQHANGAAKETWTTAPEEWKTNYGSGTVPEV